MASSTVYNNETQPQRGWFADNAPTSPGLGLLTPSAPDNPAGSPGTYGANAPNDPNPSDWQQWFQNVVAFTHADPTSDALQKNQQLRQMLQSHGVEISPANASGETSKVRFPGQSNFTRVWGLQGSTPSWTWVPQGNSSGGSGSELPVAPFQHEAFTDQFSFDPYTPTTTADVEADPGFKERLQLGLDTLQHSASAKGSLLTGQTLNDLNQYAQGYASNETQAVDARRRQDYATQYGTALQQFQQKWNQYQQGWQNAFQGWGANANLAQTNWQNAFAQAQQGFGFNQQNWQNQFSLANLGLQAALGSANVGAQYANAASNLTTGAGNAAASGSVGSGNAWSAGLGQLANYGQLYPYMNSSIYGSGGYTPGNPKYPSPGTNPMMPGY